MNNHQTAYPAVETIEEKIKTYLAVTCLINFDDNKTGNDTDLFQTGLIDSYSFVELVVFLEREFAIKVTDDDLVAVPFNSVNELVSYVREKQDAS